MEDKQEVVRVVEKKSQNMVSRLDHCTVHESSEGSSQTIPDLLMLAHVFSHAKGRAMCT